MAGPMFRVGDLVRVRGGGATTPVEAFLDAYGHTRPTGIFQVVSLLPEEKGQRQYRIRGGSPAHERIAREQDLVATASPVPPSPGG